jgi:hypothetical protein
MDKMDEQTCKGSSCRGMGENSHTLSHGSSCNSYNDKELRKSFHFFLLQVDQVLTLSAMSN